MCIHIIYIYIYTMNICFVMYAWSYIYIYMYICIIYTYCSNSNQISIILPIGINTCGTIIRSSRNFRWIRSQLVSFFSQHGDQGISHPRHPQVCSQKKSDMFLVTNRWILPFWWPKTFRKKKSPGLFWGMFFFSTKMFQNYPTTQDVLPNYPTTRLLS